MTVSATGDSRRRTHRHRPADEAPADRPPRPDLAVLAGPDRDRRRRRPVHPEPAQLRADGGGPDLEIGRTLFLISIPVGVISILVQPTVGSISDYTVSRWGRRKPYIVVGSLLDVVFLYGIATSNTVLMLAVFAGLLSFSTNIARGPFQGYVPDLVSDKQVGLASAMVGLMQILGNVVGFLAVTLAVLANRIELAIAVVAVIELLTMAAVVLRVEPGRPPKDRAGRSWASVAGETWGTDVLRERSYVWLLTSRFFFLMGGAVLVNLLITYLKQSHGLDQDAANGVYTIALILVVLGNLVAIVPSARISDRIGRKPVIYVACAIGFVGVTMAAVAPAIPMAIVGATLFGASAGTFLAVDWALMTDIIPRASSGRYMGLSNVATTASTIFAVMTGGLVIDAVNAALGVGAGPRAAFLLGAVYYVVGGHLAPAGRRTRPVGAPRRSSRRRGCRLASSRSGSRASPGPRRPDLARGGQPERRDLPPPPGEVEEVERLRPPPQVRDQRPEEHEVVEAERPGSEAEQRLELEDRQRQRREAQEDERAEDQEAPEAAARRQHRQEQRPGPTSSRSRPTTAVRRVPAP